MKLVWGVEESNKQHNQMKLTCEFIIAWFWVFSCEMKSSSSESSNPSAITKFSFFGSNSEFRRFSNTEFLEFSQIFWHFYDQFQFLFKSWFMTISKRWPWLMIGRMIIRKNCLEIKFEYSTCIFDIIFWPWILCFARIMHFHHENFQFFSVPIANFFLLKRSLTGESKVWFKKRMSHQMSHRMIELLSSRPTLGFNPLQWKSFLNHF